MRRILLIVTLLLVAAVAWWWLRPAADAPAGGAAAGTEPSTPVDVATVESVDLARVLASVGTLLAANDVTIRPEVTGRVVALPFEEGARVARGAVLARLDDAVQRAELQKAEATLAQATRDQQRVADLYASQLVSTSDRDRAQSALDQARADVGLARARLSKTVLQAPFDGVVGLRQVSVGAYVEPGQAIVRIVAADPMKIDFELPESVLSLVQAGRTITVTFDAYPGETFEGKVYALEPAVSAAGRLLRARASVPNRDGRLRAGMFGQLKLDTGTTQPGVRVPESAIVPSAEGAAVFRVQNQRAERAPVTLGVREAGTVQVTAGLAAGDVVVVAGQEKLRDGALVAPRTTAASR